MVEMLGVLAIIGVLSVGGLMAYSMGMSKYRMNKTVDQIQLAITNIRTLYANTDNNYSGLGTTVILESIPDKNPMGGIIGYAPNTNPSYFHINSWGITKQQCIQILTANWGESDIVDITVYDEEGGGNILSAAFFGKTSAEAEALDYVGGKFPISMDIATTLCKEKNSIAWFSK